MERTTCLIAGGGPAGIMLGLLLARGGVQVTVCEKHADFLRDFRGDTVHASTIQLLDELGLGPEFRALPQTRLQQFELPTGDGGSISFGDFSSLKSPYNYIAMTPQWDLLNMLSAAAKQEPTFTLRMNTEITGFTRNGTQISGATYKTASGETGEIAADLVVACDGRDSILREVSGLIPREFDVPFDVWWFNVPRTKDNEPDDASLAPTFVGKEIMLAITRMNHYQAAYFVPKGKDQEYRDRGINDFRKRIANLRPDFAEPLKTIKSMDEVKTLDVKLNRLEKWHLPGFLCIGDAAHAMSPAGGVGINLAIQDAVAAATILAAPLREKRLTEADLDKVRQRRMWPTVVLQKLQEFMQEYIFKGAFEGKRSGPPKSLLFIMKHVPFISGLPPRMIAFGPRPEHAPDFARRPERTDT